MIGDLLQLLLIVLPILRLGGRRSARLDRPPLRSSPPLHDFTHGVAHRRRLGASRPGWSSSACIRLLARSRSHSHRERSTVAAAAREIVLVMACCPTALIVATGMFSLLARLGVRQRCDAVDSLTGSLQSPRLRADLQKVRAQPARTRHRRPVRRPRSLQDAQRDPARSRHRRSHLEARRDASEGALRETDLLSSAGGRGVRRPHASHTPALRSRRDRRDASAKPSTGHRSSRSPAAGSRSPSAWAAAATAFRSTRGGTAATRRRSLLRGAARLNRVRLAAPGVNLP